MSVKMKHLYSVCWLGTKDFKISAVLDLDVLRTLQHPVAIFTPEHNGVPVGSYLTVSLLFQ